MGWRGCRCWCAERNLGQLLCLLSGVKRTFPKLTSMSAFDPKRTWPLWRDGSCAAYALSTTFYRHWGVDDGEEDAQKDRFKSD